MSDPARFILAITAVFGGSAFAQTGACLIQSDTVGPIHGGMTVAQARQALRGSSLRAAEDADRLPIWSVMRNGLHTMDLYFDIDDPAKEHAKIELIRVFDSGCTTRDGIHAGMPLAEVGQRYGRLTRLRVTDTESREYAEFERLPPWLEIQVGNGQAGVYPPGKRCTAVAMPSARVASLWVSHPITNKLPEDQSTCAVPAQRR